ncbi:MAG: DUF1385 domain-containing protein [Clostridia bacterium]|nr:DUF1385 domain-containing protein [Clostridia bacterium]
MAKKEKKQLNCRLGKVGGQAVIEGVMMKSGEDMAIASRLPDGSIKVTKQKFVSARSKHKALDFPIIRGVVNFVEMMKLSYKTMDASTAALGLEDEEPSKFEKWLSEKLHIDITTFVMVIGLVLGLGLAAVLFILLPGASGKGLSKLFSWISGGTFVLADHPVLFALIEGVMKVIIFIVYLSLVSLMSGIRRVFEYHGAEHKAVFCYEAGEELTPENVKKFKRFHPRCGTSFMFFMILLGILIGCFIPSQWPVILRSLTKIALLPLTAGLGYELIRFAGSHDNWFIRALSAPGLWVQRITTKEPDEKQMECAIAALKSAIPKEFPGYEPSEQFTWEGKKADEPAAPAACVKTALAIKHREEKAERPHLRAATCRMTRADKLRYIRRNG